MMRWQDLKDDLGEEDDMRAGHVDRVARRVLALYVPNSKGKPVPSGENQLGYAAAIWLADYLFGEGDR